MIIGPVGSRNKFPGNPASLTLPWIPGASDDPSPNEFLDLFR